MKSVNKSAIAVIGALFASIVSSVNAASAVLYDENNPASGYHLNGTDNRVYDLGKVRISRSFLPKLTR